MKQTIKLTLLALFLMAGLKPVSAKDRVTEMEDSVQLIKARFDSLKDRERQLLTEIQNLELDVIVSKDTINHMTARLESLKEKWESLNYENDELKKVTVTDEDIAKINNNIDQYQISFVQMASAFLYMPYNKGAVEKIAIPAFDQSSGSSYYKDYSIILKLLNHYEADANQLLNFIDKARIAFDHLDDLFIKKELSNERIPDVFEPFEIREKLNNLKKEFNYLPCVKDYKEDYGDGWEDTYLGEIINGIDKIFNDRSTAKNLNNVSKIFKGYLERLQ